MIRTLHCDRRASGTVGTGIHPQDQRQIDGHSPEVTSNQCFVIPSPLSSPYSLSDDGSDWHSQMKPKSFDELSTEELAAMPDWMVPPSRKLEIEKFKGSLRRGSNGKSEEEKNRKLQENRVRAGLNPDGSMPDRIERGSSTSPPAVEYGPRGGRFTRNKDGYRRYF